MADWWPWLLGLFAGSVLVYWVLLGTTEFAAKSGPPAPPDSPSAAGQVVYYRTRDGQADYGFRFEGRPGGPYRIYIVSQPGYGIRSTGAHATHRLCDGSRQYVCWTGVLQTEEQARKVAALWAEKTQNYIRTGIF